jgi:hypothetical protein
MQQRYAVIIDGYHVSDGESRGFALPAVGPVLVECAARPPGDRITNLIPHAYGVASSDRAGCVQVVGPDVDAAWRRATAAIELIKVITR